MGIYRVHSINGPIPIDYINKTGLSFTLLQKPLL